jgi:hypothetical protein
MVPSVAAILQRFTAAWATRLQPEALLTACGEVGYPAGRDRVLTPGTTSPLGLLQIPHGTTACSHLPQLSGLRCSLPLWRSSSALIGWSRVSRAATPALPLDEHTPAGTASAIDTASVQELTCCHSAILIL